MSLEQSWSCLYKSTHWGNGKSVWILKGHEEKREGGGEGKCSNRNGNKVEEKQTKEEDVKRMR